jgi:hypothetical protein
LLPCFKQIAVWQVIADILPRRWFVFGANNYVVEQNQMAQFTLRIAVLNNEAFFDQSSLNFVLHLHTLSKKKELQQLDSFVKQRRQQSSNSYREHVFSSGNIKLIKKTLRHLQSGLKRLVFFGMLSSVFEQVVQYKRILLHSSHRLVQQICRSEKESKWQTIIKTNCYLCFILCI